MKTPSLAIGLMAVAFGFVIAGASLAVASAESPSPSPSLTPSPTAAPDWGGPRCTLYAASVEVHTFYGSKEIVTEKVANMPVDLSERRVFLQVTQSGREDGAKTDVKVFEKQKDGSFAITLWTKATARDLFDKLDDAIIKNKGKECVGEAMKDVLTKTLGTGKPVTPLMPPTSPKDALGPSVQDSSGDFIKTIIIFGC
jgi:hypothetical protein